MSSLYQDNNFTAMRQPKIYNNGYANNKSAIVDESTATTSVGVSTPISERPL